MADLYHSSLLVSLTKFPHLVPGRDSVAITFFLSILPTTVLSDFISNGGGTFAHPTQLSDFHLSELVIILGIDSRLSNA